MTMPEIYHQTTGQGRDILLLHGYGGSACSWKLVVDKLNERYRTTIVELSGFGQSVPPFGFDYSVQSQAKALQEFVSENFATPPTIIAHSYGAAVMLVSIIDEGMRPPEVVLIDPLAYPQRTPFFIGIQTIPFVSDLVSRLVPPRVQVDTVLKKMYYDIAKVNDVVRDCYISEFSIPHHREALRQTAIKMRQFKAEKYVRSYANLPVQISIIWGRNDAFLDVSLGDKLAKEMNAISYKVIENCGHAPHEECPEKFVDALVSILG